MNKSITICKILLILGFFLLSESTLKADEGFSTKGKDFILAFIPNYHNNFTSSSARMNDSLSIYIVAEVPTTGTIVYRDRNNKMYIQGFIISDPKVIYRFKLSAYNYELWGLNQSGTIEADGNQCEMVAKNTFRITADNDVNVYAHSQAETTSESLVALPTNVLNNHYLVMAYPSDDQSKMDKGFSSNGKTPSQFVVIATADSTKIKIIPSKPTFRFGLKEQNIILNKDEAYLVQANINNSTNLYDLTGSEIISDKPIAVIAGHQRASIKSYASSAISPSRDFLMEQLMPTDALGKTAIVIPFAQTPDIENNYNGDLFRVMATEDSTKITFNGKDTLSINKAQFYEATLDNPYYIQSTKPIMVMSYKKSSKSSGGNNFVLSDPLMLSNPPIDRLGNFYRFINIQAYEGGNRVYTRHYIGVIIRKNGLKTLKLDNALVQSSFFDDVPTTDYQYANLELSEGIHEIQSQEPFCLFIYGYGYANSYGYLGGMVFKKIDYDAPKLLGNGKCFELNGTVTDSLDGDSGLASVISPIVNMLNTTVKIEPFKLYGSIANFSGKIINKYEDGQFEIIATDSIGFETNAVYDIPGFTVGLLELANNINIDTLYKISSSLFYKRDFCRDVQLHNYGKFEQNITKIAMKSPNSIFSISITAPFKIKPNETITITLCDTLEIAGKYSDSLYIEGDCTDRVLAAIELRRIDDKEAPKVTTKLGPCNKYTDISITDSLTSDSGLMDVEFVDSTNCYIRDNARNPLEYSAILEVSDPYQDAFYQFNATDSLGNVAIIKGSIPGFTLSLSPFQDADSTMLSYDFGRIVIGGMTCKKIQLHNYGNFTFVINDIATYSNNKFSIPSSQLPIEIAPKSSKMIDVCFTYYKASADTLRDTFEIGFNCLKRIAPLYAIVDSLKYNPDSKCDFPIQISASEAPFENYIKSSKPNPATNSVTLQFGLANASNIEVLVYDTRGVLRKKITKDNLSKGDYEILIDTNELESGLYSYRLITNSGSFLGTVIISK